MAIDPIQRKSGSKQDLDPDPAADLAAARLRTLGYLVDRLPSGGAMSCDLRAVLRDEALLIEVKSPQLDGGSLKHLRRGEPIDIHRGIARSRDRARQFDKAAYQLASTARSEEAALRVVWTRCRGPGDMGRSLESFCTLYGIRWYHITASPAPLLVNIIPVYLADRSWLRSHPEISAVVEEGPNGLSLRTNPFATERARLTRSALFRTVFELGGVFDLDAAREVPGIFVVDGDGVAPEGSAVRASLLSKYGIEVEGAKLTAESTAWPGNEMGGHSPVPGWHVGVLDHRWFEWLAEQEAVKARQNRAD